MKVALQFMLLSLIGCCPAMALDNEKQQDRGKQYEYGTALVCDTQRQAERYVSLFNGDEQETVDKVNAEERNPSACAFADVAYLRGAELAVARSKDSAFQIVPILVVGVNTPTGIRPVRPVAYFTLFKVVEYDV